VDPVGGLALGPDGTLYFCNFSTSIGNSPLVRRITTNGFIATIAGSAIADGFNGDNILAVNAHLSCNDVTVGPDFSVYVVDLVNRRVRRITQGGIINTVAGNGTNTLGAEGVDATTTSVVPNRVAIGPEGNLYIGENTVSVTGGATLSRIRRVSPDGIITTLLTCPTSSCGLAGLTVGPDGSLYYVDKANTVGAGARIKRLRPTGSTSIVAGSGSCTLGVDGIVNALPALQANLCNAYGLAVGPDETLYFGDTNSPAIAAVKVDGTMGILAGVASGSLADGVLARDAELDGVDVKLGPDGAFYLSTRGTSGNARIRRISASLPGFANSAFVVSSTDGREVYSFDAQGRHLNTRHALTGAILRSFTYDSAGRLTQITEKTGGTDNVTTIQHDAGGNPTAVIGPYGQITALAVDANGFLASVKNPANETVHLASTPDGLLTGIKDARGKASAYAFDGLGRLKSDADPIGGSQTLARTTAPNQYQVTRTTPLLRTNTYKVEELAGDVHRTTSIAPDGTQIVSSDTRDAGATVSKTSDGSVTTTLLTADPRFGMQSPVQASLNIAIPGGPTFTGSSTLTAVLSNPLDPFSMTSISETTALAGRSSGSTFVTATSTATRTSPAGRTSSMTLDAFGRAISSQVSGLDPTSITYDSRGRVATVTRGVGASARTTTLSYNAAGFLQSLTDPIGRVFQMTYDAAGRILSKTFADGHAASVTYDAAGNVASLSPPGRPAHAFSYSDRDELTSVTPPAVAGTGPSSYSYNLDKQAAVATLPGGDMITLSYDSGGRVATRTLSGSTSGAQTSTYNAAGQIASIATTGGVTVTHTHAGPLLTARTWSGLINGAVSRTFDTSLRVASESVDGSNAVTFTYDNDDLLVGAGALTISRDAQNGLITGSQLGATTTTVGNNGFGEVVSYGASANGTAVFVDALVRDALGRIAQKTETVDGIASTYAYSYDLAGQLIGVTKNAAVIESYVYDSNGNRTSAATNGGAAAAATYDNQDRLIQYGSVTVTYDAAGNLKTRTSGGQTTSYHYDQLGNLLSVSLPGGTVISYVVDGNNRRVGKKVNGVLTQGFLYGDGLRVAAELDGSGSVVSRFVYGGTHVPAYMVRGGVAFRIITDQLGSVRVVINSASGAVVQRMDYDSYGNVTLDTNPGFQPFGFASGLYDPATGLLRFSVRDYDPPTGRWTAKDPTSFAGGDANLYRYVRNNPVNRVDPLGTTDTSGLEHLTPENRDDIFFIIALVGSDSGFTDTLDFPLAGFPGSGTARNIFLTACGALWNTAVFGANRCADDQPYRRDRFCTGIADSAEAIVRRAMASGSFPGLRLQGITRDYPVTHDAMQVIFPDGQSVVLDWHHSLTPFDPQVQQVTTFFGL
jgi:RHS repeat-associated protein